MNHNPGAAADLSTPRQEEDSRQAAVHHHGQMLTRLTSLVSALVHGVEAGDKPAEHEAHEVLVEWCETELVPHILAEEGLLYGGAHPSPEAELLIDGLLADHQGLISLLEELRGADGVRAAVAAGTLERLFALHLGKENTLLLPFVAAAPGLSLTAAVQGLQELVGEHHVLD